MLLKLPMCLFSILFPPWAWCKSKMAAVVNYYIYIIYIVVVVCDSCLYILSVLYNVVSVMSPVTNKMWCTRLPRPWPRSSSPAGRLRGAWCPAPQRWTRCPDGTARRPPGWGWERCNIHPGESGRTEYGHHVRNTVTVNLYFYFYTCTKYYILQSTTLELGDTDKIFYPNIL